MHPRYLSYASDPENFLGFVKLKRYIRRLGFCEYFLFNPDNPSGGSPAYPSAEGQFAAIFSVCPASIDYSPNQQIVSRPTSPSIPRLNGSFRLKSGTYRFLSAINHIELPPVP